LGPYEVIAPIGEGGMGQVYRARDTKLNRDVALKVLPDSFANDPDRLARFQREAQVLASLNHPNIAHIHGLEESGGVRALVMELVEGEDLAQRLTRGAIPIDEALPIAKQIADALETAHEQGIIHRDLKPANIKVRPDGTVKVLDFGLAKAMETVGGMSASLSMSPTITSPAMTQAGMILGTAAYMSPEQARGKPIDKRADIWAFGCVVLEMLTGRRTFDAEDVSLTLADVMKSEPDWTALPALPPAVRMCLRRCLKKDPRQRLRDIGEARLALEGAFEIDGVIDGLGASHKPARPVWQWLLPFVAASAMAAVSIPLWLQRSRMASLPEVVRFEIHAAAGSRIPLGTPAISPDGRTLAYVVTGPDGTNLIHLRDMGATESRPLPGTENAVHPFWSPDGRSLAFVNVGDRILKRIDVAGGPARQLSQVSGPWHGSWNQFGDLLLQINGVSRMPAEGGIATPIVKLDTKAGEVSSGFPIFLRDGRRFLLRIDHGDAGSAVYLASLTSPERKLVLDGVFSAVLVAPTPGGKTYLLYLRDDALVAQEFDEDAGNVHETPRLLVTNIGRLASPPIMPAVGVSPNGTLAFQTGAGNSTPLHWLSRTGERLESTDLAGTDPSLSPDGRWVAVAAFTGNDRDVWVTDLARNVTSRLTRLGGIIRSAIWSPDSKRLAFGRSGKMYVKNADGSAEETVLANIAGLPSSWSPDGDYLLYNTQQGKLFLWRFAGGGTSIAVGSRDGSSRDGRLSPDGRYIAYVSDESGRDEIYLQSLPPATGRVQVSGAGGSLPRWSRTSRELFFMAADRVMMAVDVPLGPTPSAGVPRKLFPLNTSFVNFGYDVSADGQRFLVSRTREDVPDAPITVVLNWWAEFAKRSN
jgi:Tol biopolymer transport system component